ncbi:MAG: O-antigen ligase family protein [Solirubrobacterales bacterium]
MSARAPTLTEAGAAGPWSPATAPRSDLGPWLRAQARLLRANPDLLVVALLFLLMACGSRSFAKTIHIGPLYVTEMLIGLAGILAIVRLGLRRSWEALRRLPLIPLALIWLLGAIATARGVADFGFSMVKNDIGLVDYTLILPLLALVLTDRKRFEAMFSVLVACGFIAIVTYLVLFTVDQLAGTADTMLDAIPVAYGLYISLAVVWIAARLTNCLPTPRWLTLFVPAGLVLMNLTTVRSLWLVAIISLTIVVLCAPRGRTLRSALALAAVVAVSLPVALGIETAINKTGDEVTTASTANGAYDAAGGSATSTGGPDSEAQLSREITSLGGGDSSESANVRWRLAYWQELLSRVPSDPLLGVGFGQPAAFTWHGVKYDYRDNDPNTSFNVAGPHNSFVAWIYRLGVIGFAALALIIFLAVRNVWRALRGGALDPARRTMLVSLVAWLGGASVVVGFNETLTGPFLSIFFWAPLAMLLLWPAIIGGAGVNPEQPGAAEPA